MTMRIQVTDEIRGRLEELSRRTGRSLDELVNEALEHFVSQMEVKLPRDDWKAAVMQAAGMWKDRDDLPDFAQLRKSWDRGYGRE
ncbi:MAG: CopG family transcriptional regulator [Phycisphaerales bacterium]|nr:CopG family transcriptional regulator [Phycisphaerales bacterium]